MMCEGFFQEDFLSSNGAMPSMTCDVFARLLDAVL